MATAGFFPKVTTAPSNSRYYVSKKFESLDYDHLDCPVFIEEEEIRGKSFMINIVIQRVSLFVIIGIITGTVGAIIEIAVTHGSFLRYSILYDVTYLYLDTNFPKMFFFWTLSIFIPAFIASVLVVYGEPLAQGGGTHFAISYLNGVNLRKCMKFKVVLIKVMSNILSVISGLPAGKEGPLVFIGAAIGSLSPLMGYGNFQPFNYFHQDSERRDMGSAGTAAGFTAAFGTPIAGIMIAFEENLTLWCGELTFLIFISALTTFFTLKFLVNSIVHGCIDCVVSKENLFLKSMQSADKSYFLFEIPLYILFGILGGLFGAIWNLLQDQLLFLRQRIIDGPVKKLLEITLVIIINGIIQISSIKYLEDSCVQYGGSGNLTESRSNPSHIKLHCKDEKEYSVAGLLFFQNTGGVFRSLFTQNESHVGLMPLTIFGIYYYFGSLLLVGCQLCNGIFMPHIVIGNIWGRSIAEMINISNPQSVNWARPNKFALLCGAAQLCGTLRTTFTICVMMLESCNDITLGIPIFIVVFTSRFIGNLITIPMCQRLCSYVGIPLLEREPPPLLTHIKIKEIIASGPVATLPLIPSYNAVRETLTSNSHNGFPVVSNQKKFAIKITGVDCACTRNKQTPNGSLSAEIGQITKQLILNEIKKKSDLLLAVRVDYEGYLGENRWVVSYSYHETGLYFYTDDIQSYGSLKGLISRSQLNALLKYKDLLNQEDVSLRKKMNLLREQYSSANLNPPRLKRAEENDVIDLTPYMNTTPHFVHLNVSLSHAYRMFSALGLRHLVVVNSSYEVVGMITRKDLSVFRFIRYGPYMDIMKLPLRNN